VTASSSNTDLISDPAVTYTSAEATGSIAFTPLSEQIGTATITVTVEDGGLDGDLATSSDNLATSTSFDVTVTPNHPWHNYVIAEDVNDDGIVTPIDALLAVNEINAGNSGALSASRSSIAAPFYDVSKDGRLNAADVLQIIDSLNSTDYLASITVTATDAAGQVITTIETGSLFYLDVSVEDWRENVHGVFAAYADIYYDANHVTIAGTPTFEDPYVNDASYDLGTPGIVDEWGAFAGLDETGASSHLLARLPLRADSAGTVLFGSSSADQLPDHDVLLYALNSPLAHSQINYGAFLLEITAAEGEGEGEYAASVDAVLAELYGTDDSLR
jgi:hypothetical protein